MEPMLKNLQQAAAEIPCSPRWLADGLRSGRFPGHKIGRRWMLSEVDISTIIEACSVRPAAIVKTDATVRAPSSLSSMTQTTRRHLKKTYHR
ncbi:helix-turn-helix domain-containing protein [Mycobacterium kubicae]|uniref:Helix-turn-helix domain-containing protein n=1 Tax=Mycobacterium kubicae TaxID=120959 RepID=A0AAX1J6C4_9MYCO|nr:helix-turn-helix domain-containing protein [Mycobacterium kubicae]QPI36980.1 helix-turn-helix domain-containing protein [Mycobacterium kubicae]